MLAKSLVSASTGPPKPEVLAQSFRSVGEPNYGPDFDGSDYSHALDHGRLTGQLRDVYEAMKDGEWRTLPEIRALTGLAFDASVSKHLRHLRYEKFGAYLVEKRRVDEHGLWEYRVGAKGAGTPQRSALAVENDALRARVAELEERCAACPRQLSLL